MSITGRSPNMPWYKGPALLPHLETVELDTATMQDRPFRMAVQWVNRPNLDFRGFSGLISSGVVKKGDAIRVLPSGKTSKVTRIVTLDGDLDEAVAGQSVTVCFADEIDCSRGDVICAAQAPVQAADQFETTIVWMDENEMLPGRPYWLKIGALIVTATIQQPKYQVSVNTMERSSCRWAHRARKRWRSFAARPTSTCTRAANTNGTARRPSRSRKRMDCIARASTAAH
jgi:bifunctional enzyme CysN/CysC